MVPILFIVLNVLIEFIVFKLLIERIALIVLIVLIALYDIRSVQVVHCDQCVCFLL
jgi:hypothetical protein